MSDLTEKVAKANAGGHSISPSLEAILKDFDKRLAALEPKKADHSQLKSGPKP